MPNVFPFFPKRSLRTMFPLLSTIFLATFQVSAAFPLVVPRASTTQRTCPPPGIRVLETFSSSTLNSSSRRCATSSSADDDGADERSSVLKASPPSSNTDMITRRSAITSLTALALGGRALTRKPKTSSAEMGIKDGVKALNSRPPATSNRGLAATAAVAAGWGSSVDMPVFNRRKLAADVPSLPVVNPLPRIDTGVTAARSITARIQNWLGRTRRIARAFLRAVEVVALAMPAAILYPAVMAKKRKGGEQGKKLYDRWLNLCVHSAEKGGAVVIKLCQWASSRPDVFGIEFADKFKKLQDSTTPHKWSHTEKCLIEAYGETYQDHLRIEKENILGSGCIAQVYKGHITDDDGKEQPVAIKVVHPNVRKVIAKDLQILRYLSRTLERLPFGYGEKFKWNNLSGAVDEFALMLEPQLDLKNEAKHIQRLNENFRYNDDVIFPELIQGYETSSDVLVETFCDGVPVKEFCEKNKDDLELRAKICNLGAKTMCEMIFEHNYVHGDVHPGNCLVSPDNKLILLDCGIVNEYSERDHDLAINVIAAFIRMDGRRAAEFLVDNSNQNLLETTGEQALEVEQYLDEIGAISTMPVRGDFAFEKVSMYINKILDSASTHHVRITPAFVSMALAIKVQEGIALMLDPKSNIIHVANPIIMKAEAKRLRQGNFDRLKTVAADSWRDFKVRREREQNKQTMAASSAH